MSVREGLIKQWLTQRKVDNLYRQQRISDSPQQPEMLVDGRLLKVFCSNDYLGLANHPDVIHAFQQGAKTYGVGSGSAHLVNGHFRVHHELEEALAHCLGRERVVLFSSGFAANLSVMDVFCDKNSSVLQDRLNHASLLDGARLAGAYSRRYHHADMQHLEHLLQRLPTERRMLADYPMIASDSVFSMDGDQAPMKQLVDLAQQYQSWLYIDDAHGMGVLGQGYGVIREECLDADAVPLLMTTFGKALGTAGAAVSGSEELMHYLLNRARPWIFTTAMPPAIASATLKSIELLETESWRIGHLHMLIAAFKQGMSDQSWQLISSDTAIQPILIGSEEKALLLSEKLLTYGILVSAIRHPTVAKNQARLRITLSASHTLKDIEYLLNVLDELSPIGKD